MNMARTAAVAAILLAGLGCRSEPPPAAPVNPPVEPAPSASAAMLPPSAAPAADMHCPLELNGTTMAYSDTTDGIRLNFTTNATGQVPELRARVNRMAIMHSSRAAGGRAAGGGMDAAGSGHDMPPEGTGMPPMHGEANAPPAMGSPVASSATVRDLPNGASLTLVPRDPTHVSRLREHVRMHAQQMQQTGRCLPPSASQPPTLERE
jgi:hypothetical protein